MMVGDRFGGHFVQGHVDATGRITRLEASGQDHIVAVSLPPEIHLLCVDKGSLAIDGISLTIAELRSHEAVFWITPHTWEHTHLHAAAVGQAVNLEADMLAKYVAKLVEARLPQDVTYQLHPWLVPHWVQQPQAPARITLSEPQFEQVMPMKAVPRAVLTRSSFGARESGCRAVDAEFAAPGG